MGVIYQRGKTWYVDLRVKNRRIRKKVGPSKHLAELVLKDLEVKAARSEFEFDPADASLEELFSAYLTFSKTNHSPNTTRRYWDVIRNFKIFLAFYHPDIKNISDLSLDLFEQYKAYRKEIDPRTLDISDDFPIKIPGNSFKAKSKTINYEVKTIRSILNFGIKRGMCGVNPAKGVTLLKITDSKRPRFLTREECERFLAHCRQKYFPIFYTFLNTGLRLGELVNLQWADIDFGRRKLIVQAKDFWKPKTGGREIPLNDSMIELLSRIRPPDAKKKHLVFPGNDGASPRRKLRMALVRIAKRAEIEDFTSIHSLRHTFASHLVMSGVDLPTVQKLLGHADIQTTMIYSHLAPDHLVGAVNKLSFG